jgi:anaerobic selenocysteine-containing dehydrogenase
MSEDFHDVRSFCRICNAMCGIVVTVADETIVRVRGDDAHPLSRGYTCPKGRALGQFHYDPRRLNVPLIGDRIHSWDITLEDLTAIVSSTIESHGPDSVGMYLASGSAFDSNGRRAAERFLHLLGSKQKYTATTIDTPSKPLVAELIGGWSGLTPVWDHERSQLLLLIGTNPLVSHGHSNAIPDPVVRLREHQAKGGAIWVIDPRRTETAQLADRHLMARPSTDHLVLAYLVRELLLDGADHEYLRGRAVGVDTLAGAVASCTREMVAAASGLDEADLAALLDAVRKAGTISALTGTGVSMGAHANVTEWLLWALHIITASYDRPGGMWFNPGYLSQLDTRTWSPADGTPGPGPASRPDLPRRFGEYPCAALVPEIEAGNLRVLFVVGGNPLCALPGEDRLRAAFEELTALVVIDVIRTDTTDVATHVLPAAGQLERADLPWLLDAYQLAVATQYTPAVLQPTNERWPVWKIFAELGARLGIDVLPRGITLAEANDDVLLARIAEASRSDAESVFAAPSGVVHSGAVFGWVHERVLADGRWRLAPAVLVEQFVDALAAAPGDQLFLIPQRQLRKMNSQLRDIGKRTDEVFVQAHPDAVKGLTDGTWVLVQSPFGMTFGQLRLDPTMSPHAVSIPHGWAETNVCALTDTDAGVDPHSGMVWQSGIPVTVRAL